MTRSLGFGFNPFLIVNKCVWQSAWEMGEMPFRVGKTFGERKWKSRKD